MSLKRKITRQLLKLACGRALGRLVLDGALHEYGWVQSANERVSIDKNGKPIPWIAYPAISFIEKRIKPDFKIFEYGSGNSTRWWADKIARIDACEHDLDWYKKTSLDLPNNANINYCDFTPNGDYCKFINQMPYRYDVIVVDGRDRVNCIKYCLNNVSEAGVIILDNSDRPYYRPGIDFLESAGFKELEFFGLGPSIDYITCTSIFYRDVNCLGI